MSSEEQAKGDKVSIDNQLADMRQLCERNGWLIHQTFIDCENYKATQSPKKGKVVSPSGERADRPQFLEMLDIIRSGEVDAVLCWRDDRIMRHPRVAVALEDALDVGDVSRIGKGKIAIYDATGSIMDRFTLSIKAVIWREENKRRVERIKLGKIGTLKEGRWPGSYIRFGYMTRKEEGKRGCIIELGDPAEIKTVKDIYNWFDRGLKLREIAKKLILRGDQQPSQNRKYDWNHAIIAKILRAEDYTGVASWNFEDQTYTIKIPAVVSHEQWERVQKRLDSNRQLSSRKTSEICILQHLIVCGECGGGISPQVKRYYYGKLASGKLKRYTYNPPILNYNCHRAASYHLGTEHPTPYRWRGRDLEWAVWRYLVDNGIKRPDLIIHQVQARQQLIEQGDSLDGDIGRARSKIVEINQERTFYQRQAARGKITESEFDARMDDTQEALDYWQDEIDRLTELRDNAVKVRAGIDYTLRLLQSFEIRLGGIDIPPNELEKLPKAKQKSILKEQQKIVRALCDKITIYANGQIVIDGLLDGSEFIQFELPSLHNG